MEVLAKPAGSTRHGENQKSPGVFSLTPQPAGFLKIIWYFWGLSKGLGLCVPIIYNRMERRTYDILIIIDWCLLGWFSWGRSFTIKFCFSS